jgi:large subunit ribosomal protein L10
VGLNLLAAYEENMVFPKEVLEVDSDKVYGDVLNAIQYGINLSVNARYPTKITTPIIIGDAYRKALNLAVNAGVVNRDTVELILSRAYREMLGVASRLTDGLDDELKSLITSSHAEVKSEPQKDEAKEEKKEEEEEENKEEEAIAGLGSLFG